MKPKYFLALGLLVLGLGSCGESFFEQYPSNNITEGNFYKTDDDFNQGVVACYAKLKTQMSFHLTEIGYRGDENVLESMAYRRRTATTSTISLRQLTTAS